MSQLFAGIGKEKMSLGGEILGCRNVRATVSDRQGKVAGITGWDFRPPGTTPTPDDQGDRACFVPHSR
jgi:hypothetical protein